MPTACVLQRHEREPSHFWRGCEAAGFRVSGSPAKRPARGDLLLIWNRQGLRHQIAHSYESAGAKVIVAENGYIGRAPDGGKMYALARSHHNGRGHWQVGGDERFAALGVELKPWRERGEHILILAQRGFGEPGVAMPRDWPDKVKRRLRGVTARPVRLRAHPGLLRTPLEPDFENVHACVTWGSGAAIKAIAAGVPVFHELPGWIGAPAARFGLDRIEDPFLGDRLPMFRRLAWAQFSAKEIETGEPIRRCLSA